MALFLEHTTAAHHCWVDFGAEFCRSITASHSAVNCTLPTSLSAPPRTHLFMESITNSIIKFMLLKNINIFLKCVYTASADAGCCFRSCFCFECTHKLNLSIFYMNGIMCECELSDSISRDVFFSFLFLFFFALRLIVEFAKMREL